jgi:hypothetical protein
MHRSRNFLFFVILNWKFRFSQSQSIIGPEQNAMAIEIRRRCGGKFSEMAKPHPSYLSHRDKNPFIS